MSPHELLVAGGGALALLVILVLFARRVRYLERCDRQRDRAAAAATEFLKDVDGMLDDARLWPPTLDELVAELDAMMAYHDSPDMEQASVVTRMRLGFAEHKAAGAIAVLRLQQKAAAGDAP